MSTDQTTYERLFGAIIEYQSWTVQTNDSSRIRPYQISDWVELKPAQIPDSLKGIIRDIELNIKYGLID